MCSTSGRRKVNKSCASRRGGLVACRAGGEILKPDVIHHIQFDQPATARLWFNRLFA